MIDILIGTLLVAIGGGMVYSVLKSVRAGTRARQRADPAVFATLDLKVSEYRAKPAPANPLAKVRGEPRRFETPREPRLESSPGLFARERGEGAPNEGRPAPALRIHGLERDEDAEQKTLGL